MEPRHPGKSPAHDTTATDPVYSPTARRFHWWTVAFVALMVPVGLYMVWRGSTTNFDALTGRIYDAHKLGGFLLLWLVVARLVYRFRNGAPPDEPTIEPWQKVASHVTHWSLYALLLTIPLLGWLGVSYYGATSIFGLFSLPQLVAKDTATAEAVFTWHFRAAMLLVLLLGAHVGAALFHYVIRKDGVLRRMLPGVGRRVG